MQEPKLFRLENIHEILMGQSHQTSLTWQGKKQVFSHKEPDERLKGDGIVSFGGMALCTSHIWENISHVTSLLPLFAEKGITSTLWMRTDTPSPLQLAEEARLLKDKIATHLGWLLPLVPQEKEERLKKLEESPAVCGFWMDANYMRNIDIALLSHIQKPIIIDADGVEASVYERVLKAFIAIEKRPIILNGSFFHPRDYENLVELQSVATMLSSKAGSSIGGVYMPIFSHQSQLNEKCSFWANWLGENIEERYWRVFFAQQQIYKAYKSFGLMFKGRKMPGYDADIVVLDESFFPKTVILAGKIIYWKGEFTHTFTGSALKVW